MPNHQEKSLSNLFGALCIAVLVSACDKPPESTNGAPAASSPAPSARPAGPPVSITAVSVRQEDFLVTLPAVGTVVPVNSVDVKSQMTGLVADVKVKEGQFVRAGELLFVMDARSEEANVSRLKAQLAKDEATLADARRQLTRSQDLLRKGFISQGAADSVQTLVDSQLATVAADKAAIDAAKVALSYSRIVAPSVGRAGMVTIFPGTAIQSNQTTMVTITQLNPVDVSFSLPQRNLPDALAALKAGDASVNIVLDGNQSVIAGRLQFVDNVIDAATGTVKVKARFANESHRLWPGAVVDVKVAASRVKNALIIPSSAMIQSVRGPFVYVIENGKVVQRPVTVLAINGDQAAVSGVSAGDRVVVDGRQNLRPDAAVVERGKDDADRPAPTDGKPAPGVKVERPAAP